MAMRYLFADEAGCFAFTRGQNISTYFIICTVTLSDLKVGDALSELRRKMIWERDPVADFFHATSDRQVVRDKVFAEMLKHDFRVQAIICEKAKAQPQVRSEKARFYKYPWYYMFKFGISKHLSARDSLMVVAASVGTKKERSSFTTALGDVMDQTLPHGKWVVDFRQSNCDPCLQLADYCAWAIQRKWEKADTRAYDLIKDRITYEHDLWAHGTKLYY